MAQTVNKTLLNNGIIILSKSMPHVRSVSMGVWVNVGARDEKADQSGLSHFIEHMIFKGTKKRSAFQIAREFDAIGGQSNAFTSMEHTCYHARVLDVHLSTMIGILSDVFLNSVFDDKEIELERPVILQEIGMSEDNPEDYAHQLAAENFWGGTPLGRPIIGRRENINGFNRQTLKNFFNHFYKPDKIIIAIAGNIEHDQFVDMIGPAFEAIPKGNSSIKRKPPRERFQVNIHPKKLEQIHLCLGTKGLSITNDQRFAFSLLNTIIGGNMSSRLFQKIREQSGLAYSVYSYISSFEDTGNFGVYTGVHPDNTSAALKLMIAELNNLRTKAVTDNELKDSKEYIKGNLLLATESVDNQMVRLAQNEFHFGKQISIQSVLDNFQKITPDDILTLASDLFATGNRSLTVLGPIDPKTNLKDFI